MITDIDPQLKYIIPRLRREHGDLYALDVSRLPGKYGVRAILLRPLTRQEFFRFEADMDLGCDIQEEVLRECLVYPEVDWNNEEDNFLLDLPYGDFDRLSDAVMYISGFTDVTALAALFERAREQSLTLDAVVTTVVCKHFPGISADDVDKMNMREITEWFGKAEQFLEQPVDIRLFLDPDYAKKQEMKARRKEIRSASKPPRGVRGRRPQRQQRVNRMNPEVEWVPEVPEGWQSSSMMPNELAG